MKKKKINTSYDQFGGHSSGHRTFKIQSDKPKNFFQRTAEQLKHDKPIRDKVAKDLETIFADSAVKRQWQDDIKDFQQNKAAYDKKKSAGRKIKPADDPFPLATIFETGDLSLIDPTKHLSALKTILAVFHKRYYHGLNRIISKDTVAIWPKIDKVAFSGKLMERFLEYAKPTDNYDIQENDKRKPGRPGLPEAERARRSMILKKWEEKKGEMSQRQFCKIEEIPYTTPSKNYLKTCQDWARPKHTN